MPTTPPAPPLELADLAQMRRLGDPRLSPCGEHVALVLSRPDLEHNRHHNDLVLIEVRTGRQRRLTHDRPRVGHPRFSPSGQQLAFLAAGGGGHLQIFVLALAGGEARQLTHTACGVQQLAWSPDEALLAYVTADEPEQRAGEERHNRSFEVGDDSYLAQAPPQPAHLWVVSVADRSVRRLTEGPRSVNVIQPLPGATRSLSWSPDGRAIAFLSQATPHSGQIFRLSLERVEVETGARRTLLPGPSALAGPAWSPDGARILYHAPVGPEPLFNPSGLFVVPAGGGEPRHASAGLDRDLQGAWMPDGQALLASGSDGTHGALWLLRPGQPPRRLALGDLDPASVTIGSDGALAFVGTRPQHPPELYHLASPDAEPRQLTTLHAAIASRTLGGVETIHWQGPDGHDLDGVLLTPPGFDPGRRYPLVLSIHGGPMGASLEGFAFLRQLMAVRGWLVLCPNYRGSNHRGQQLQRAILGDAGEGPGRDILAGVEALQQRGIVDTSRVAVTGWSYGGFLTTWLCAHAPSWRAAVAGAPVTDWLDSYALSDLNTWNRHGLGGPPWSGDGARRCREQSPITHAHRIRTPTLILACTGDTRVPTTQAHKLYRALRDHDVPARFVAYPVPGHYPGDPVHQRDLWRRWIQWIEACFGS